MIHTVFSMFYSNRDIAAILDRMKRFDFTKIIYVVGKNDLFIDFYKTIYFFKKYKTQF